MSNNGNKYDSCPQNELNDFYSQEKWAITECDKI